ncbi:MAG: hypothetical protein HOF75_10515 [Flavobacteriaceae bacterium]|nr:hypothetical protein [Flavobacteriaceae bacterium]
MKGLYVDEATLKILNKRSVVGTSIRAVLVRTRCKGLPCCGSCLIQVYMGVLNIEPIIKA